MMKTNEENDPLRVKFERPLEVKLMAIDGTWYRDSFLIDVSDTGAEIEVTGHGPELTEFFLMLTSFGTPVFRRCKRDWVQGARIGVSFHKTNIGMKSLEVGQVGADSEL